MIYEGSVQASSLADTLKAHLLSEGYVSITELGKHKVFNDNLGIVLNYSNQGIGRLRIGIADRNFRASSYEELLVYGKILSGSTIVNYHIVADEYGVTGLFYSSDVFRAFLYARTLSNVGNYSVANNPTLIITSNEANSVANKDIIALYDANGTIQKITIGGVGYSGVRSYKLLYDVDRLINPSNWYERVLSVPIYVMSSQGILGKLRDVRLAHFFIDNLTITGGGDDYRCFAVARGLSDIPSGTLNGLLYKTKGNKQTNRSVLIRQ